MKVYHFCQFKLRHSNGVQAAVWELARAQAALGAEVEIVSLGRAPSAEEIEAALQAGVRLRGYPGKLPGFTVSQALWGEIAAQREAVGHLHSVFIPAQSWIAWGLRRRRIPYFISPHGNLAPRELARKAWRKRLYLQGVERWMLRGAAGWLCASRREVEVAKTWGGESARALVAGNGLDAGALAEIARARNAYPRRALFFGKSDLVNKAFDRMVSAAEAFESGVDFHVVVHNQKHLRLEYESFVRAAQASSSRVRFHGPVYGEEKLHALREAGLYLHLSRWDVFGMGIMEAAMSGLPLVLSSDCDIAEEAQEAGAAYVMTSYDAPAITALQRWVEDAAGIARAGKRAGEWALANYSAPEVAKKSLQFYRECLSPRE